METTSFVSIYNKFLSKITDDMYLELTELDTYRLLNELLMSAINKFEFPRVPLQDNFTCEEIYDEVTYCGEDSDYKEVKALVYRDGCFHCKLSDEEQNILATYMVVEWFGQQLASIDLARIHYTGKDFSMSSQANHMNKLLALKSDYDREGFHLQRLYCRRAKDENGLYKPTIGMIMEV